MTGKPKHTWLIWAAIASGLFAYLTQPFIPHFDMHGVDRSAFYIGVAVSIVCMALFAYINFKRYSTFALLSLTINNLIDETIFQPFELGVNEFALVVTLCIGYFAYSKIKEYESYDA